ncbi:hypothetical protein [uncultured Methanolobus sp.]|jgi:hypothetical protein|uniref:hypothetical protein n=1 Tax=uncultured Methanolobus sp. TaxID=218300 RepID=UPI0029C618A4|nr:hypothetical protein [uncultured Methanolobus sp.]
MNKEKKHIVHEKQKYISIIYRNRKLLKVNVLILSIGLALSYLGYEDMGEPIIWLGIIIFGYAALSSYMAKKQLKQ